MNETNTADKLDTIYNDTRRINRRLDALEERDAQTKAVVLDCCKVFYRIFYANIIALGAIAAVLLIDAVNRM